jgi:arylsulfatase A-like enzyme
VFNNRPLKIEGNRTQITTDYALEFLEGRNDNQPFFLQVGYIATHSPFTGQEPELVESYKNASFQDIKTVTEHPWAWNEDFPEDHKVTPEEARLRHQNQYAAVSDIDRNIGRILEFLEKNGELDNTIIIYTSDHGLALGQKGFWGKANGTRPLNMYELSIRIPLMFYGANIARGVRVPECVDHLDTFQTICDLCGVKLEDANRPGNSFLPFLFGGKTNWNNIKFGEYGDMRIVRTPEFKLVKRYDSTMPDELFDLVNDPEEKINSIDFPEYATVRQKLEGEICRYFQKYSDPAKSGLNVRKLPRHNAPQKPSQKISSEAWRDGINELRKES